MHDALFVGVVVGSGQHLDQGGGLPGWLGRLITRRIPFTEATRALQKPPDDIKTVLTFD